MWKFAEKHLHLPQSQLCGLRYRRLTEFESTPSSQLTINEFMNIDLEAEHDPPAFYNARIRSKIQQLEAEAGGMINIECE